MPNSYNTLRLDDLSIFLAVLEARGFRAASKRLGLSPSTVSEKIARLEMQVGVPLLIRTTRSVMPTEAGQVLASRLSPLFNEARSALQDAANSQLAVRGVLKLNVTGAVMVDILPPLLDRFLALHPHVRLEIMVDDRLVDIIAAGCDAGIRYGEHLAQDMIAVPIGPSFQQLAYAAAPTYLERRGEPLCPSNLLSHDCIRFRFSSGALADWDFERGEDVVKVDPPSRVIMGVDGAAAAIELARAGCGVIGTFKNWLSPYFETGELVAVLSDWWPKFDGPQLYFSSRFMPTPLRAFVDLVSMKHPEANDAFVPHQR
jgi:DNA-binding transcriptional LysR family regulator